MSIWSLSINGAPAISPESLHLAGLRRHLANQDIDTLTCVALIPFDTSPGLEVDDQVILYRDATVWFSGLVTQLAHSANVIRQSISITVSGPHYYLNNRVYRQEWAMLQSDQSYDAARTSHLFLGQRVNWTPYPPDPPTTVYAAISEIIDDILTYAEDLGDPIAHDITNLPTEMVIPVIEERDITCAEAIRRILRWIPDTIAWWDYSTSPNPTLRFSRRSGLTATTLSLGTPPLAEIELTPRTDLLVSCVSLTYQRMDTVDGVNIPLNTVDTYPIDKTGNERYAYVATIDLKGGYTNTLSSKIVAASIDISTWAFWGSHHAAIIEGQVITFELLSYSGTMANPADPDSPDIAWDNVTYPREMIKGAWYSWMAPGIVANKATIRCRARITYQTHDGGSGQTDVRIEDLTASIIVTNAPVGSNTYDTVSESETGEQVPTGLAQSLYESLSTLHYSGRLTLREAECGDAHPSIVNWLSRAINIDQSAMSDWATMQAMIQTVDEIIDTGETTLTLGPPEHLSPQDLVQLLLMTRLRHKYTNPGVQAAGILQATASTDITPIGSGAGVGNSQGAKGHEKLSVAKTTTVGETAVLAKLALDATGGAWKLNATAGGSASSGGQEISLESGHATAGKLIRIRTVKYCMDVGPKAGESLDMDLPCSLPRDSEGTEYSLTTGEAI